MPGFVLTNLYGPAPIGCFLNPSSPTSVMYFFGTTSPAPLAGVPIECHEIGPRLVQVKPHGARIDDFDLLDMLVQLARRRALVAVEAELDVLRGHRVAVVEFHVRPQLEFVGQPVLALAPGFGEARTHLVSRIGTHQRVMDRVQHAERRDLRRRGGRVEPARRDRHVPRHHDLSGRLLRVGRFQHADADGQQPGHYRAQNCPARAPSVEQTHKRLLAAAAAPLSSSGPGRFPRVQLGRVRFTMIRLGPQHGAAVWDEHLWRGCRYLPSRAGSGCRAASAATTLSPASTTKHCSDAV